MVESFKALRASRPRPDASTSVDILKSSLAAGEPVDSPLFRFKNGMTIRTGFIDTVGNTPLIRLAKLSDETGCEILGKAEFLNPGGSVKDRAALWIIRAAEADGSLQPGGTVVEGTAGNTGHRHRPHLQRARLPLRHLHARQPVAGKGRHLLRTLGAEVRVVKTVPYKDPHELSETGRPLSPRELPGAVWANQFDNVANRLAHYESTAPGNLGADERSHRRIHLRRGYRRHAGRRQPLSEGTEART